MANKDYRDSFVVAYNSGTIAGQIVAMRHAREWTQSELAAKCGMRQPRISTLEDPEFENVEIATLQRIASACDVGLLVSFVPFSELTLKSTNLNNSCFNIKEFTKDKLIDKQLNKTFIEDIIIENFPANGLTTPILNEKPISANPIYYELNASSGTVKNSGSPNRPTH